MFQPALAAKPQIVAANKMDAVGPGGEETADGVVRLAARAAAHGLPFFRLSAVTGAGIPELLESMWGHVVSERESAHAAAGPTPA